MDLIFIGDRPAQLCALVLDEPTRYTGDKLDPFMVYRCVERYVTDNNATHASTTAYGITHNISAYRVTQRHIVLSTGLTWAPKYDGMVAKQINTLLQESFVTPIIFVLPVSSRILLGHSINAKLADLCRSSRSRQDHTRFLGNYRLANTRASAPPRVGVRGSLGGAASGYGFAGDAAYPTQPTPTEVLDMIQIIQVLSQS